MDAVFVFKLKDVEIHGHRAPSFPPLGSAMNRLAAMGAFRDDEPLPPKGEWWSGGNSSRNVELQRNTRQRHNRRNRISFFPIAAPQAPFMQDRRHDQKFRMLGKFYM
jgi:hypothetical protein